MTDQIKGTYINQNGYGTVPKMVMQDQEICIATKAVYAYFCTFTGSGDSCFPSRKKICYDLKISNDSLSKYLNELVKRGYLIIEQQRENGQFSCNVYTLPSEVTPIKENPETENHRDGNFPTREKTDTVNLDTINNSNKKINSNKKNNKESKKERKKGNGYDNILSSVSDEGLRELYYEYIKMRNFIKKPMTDRALKGVIAKVERYEPGNIERQKQLLENAIERNWLSVYPLKDEYKPRANESIGGSDLDGLL